MCTNKLEPEGDEWFNFEKHYLAIHCIGMSAIQFTYKENLVLNFLSSYKILILLTVRSIF